MKRRKANEKAASFREINPEKVYPYIAADCHIHTTPQDSWLFYQAKKDDEAGFLNYETERITHQDEEIIFSCDGRTSLSAIIKVLKSVYRIPEKRIFYLLDWLLHNGILDYSFEPLYFSTFPTFGGSRDYFVPLHIFLELTDACNQSCLHCYLEASGPDGNFMDKEKLFDLIENLSLEGTLVAELTGGEPLLHPDFDEILAFASEKFEIVSVITNGLLLDEKKVSLIHDLSRHGARILVSLTLNSYESNYHDSFAGVEGSFQQTLKAIRLLSAASVPVRVSMNVTRENLDDMFETAKLAISNGASVFAAAPVNYEGRARKTGVCFASEDEWAKFDREFLRLKTAFKDKVFYLSEPVLKEIYRFSCGAGTKTIAISPDGYVRACVLFEKEKSFGNVFKESLENILSPEKLKYFASMRGPSELGCDRCSEASYCNGCLKRMLEKASSLPSCRLHEIASLG